MRVLYLDCFSGISGDMTVAALCDLGVPPSVFEWELSKVESLGAFHMHFERADRCGISALRFKIHEGSTHTPDQDEHSHEECHAHGHSHSHSHEHPHQHTQEHDGHSEGEVIEHSGHSHSAHHHHDAGHEHTHAHGRAFRDIRSMIQASDLSDRVKLGSLAVFQRIADAEGKIHGVSAEDVTFHEVGALDSIADIICVCVGLEHLGVERVHFSRLREGIGSVECAHGRFPVPAPATIEILRDSVLEQVDEPHEMVTPTGAAIAREFGVSFGLMPPLKVLRIGYGGGARNLPHCPNVLRAVLGEVEENTSTSASSDTVTVLEANVDDLSPEIAGAVMDRLFAAGALDVALVPVHMKKNRPGFILSVVSEPAKATDLGDLILRETSSFGVRMHDSQRMKLEREIVKVETPHGIVDVKIGRRGDVILQAAPEFESCLSVSKTSGAPLKDIYASALSAWHAKR